MVERTIGSLADKLPHPGETLLELLETYGMSQLELSQRIGYTPKHINEICNGKKSITPDMALRLSSIFNLSSAFWNNLQANYDSEYNELKKEETVTEEELDILKETPVKELVDYKYLNDINMNNKKATVLSLRSFFKVSNLAYVTNTLNNTVEAYRKSDKDINPIKLASWISMCLYNYHPSTNQLDVDKLKESIPFIRKQILTPNINDAINNVKDILDKCGITFNVIQHLKGVPVQGYIRNINGNILLTLTIRNKYSDIFWFTLFHEIGHILSNKDKKTLNMVDYEVHDGFADERHADEFAENTLISRDKYNKFKVGPINNLTIKDFARNELITPSIVVGRLGHEDPIYFSRFANLRDRYEWE